MDGFMGYEKLESIVGLCSKLTEKARLSMKGFFANVIKKFYKKETPRLIGNQGRRERERRMRQMQRQNKRKKL